MEELAKRIDALSKSYKGYEVKEINDQRKKIIRHHIKKDRFSETSPKHHLVTEFALTRDEVTYCYNEKPTFFSLHSMKNFLNLCVIAESKKIEKVTDTEEEVQLYINAAV